MKFFTAIIILFLSLSAFAQTTGNVKGIILDKEMGQEPLAFATVALKDSKLNTQTDFDGNYFLNIEEGTYTLVVSFAGYEKVEVADIEVKAGVTISLDNIVLEPVKIAQNFTNSSQASVATALFEK